MIPILVFIGLCVGGQINRAIYCWSWVPRSISPWSKPPANVAARTWFDCLPVVGWWSMRRESKVHGRFFWLRPMLIELAYGAGLAAIYWWEVSEHGWPVVTFCSHAVLFTLMMIATFIDLDDKTIPDQITVPGVIIGLLFAAFAPSSMLPVKQMPTTVTIAFEAALSTANSTANSTVNTVSNTPLLLSTPFEWPSGLSESTGLWIGLLCWFGWCFALVPRTLYFRRGLIKGLRFLLASMTRGPICKFVSVMSVVGAVAILAAWTTWAGSSVLGAQIHWQTLLSSLVGLAFGGGLVWAIRIVSGGVLGIEAMGFGDVTLMAMIGAFLGWQAALMAFFIAPFTSVLIATAQYLLTGDKHIPFGPYLCAGASIVVGGWVTIWMRWGPIFNLGFIIPGIIFLAIILMGVMLAALQIFKKLIGIDR